MMKHAKLLNILLKIAYAGFALHAVLYADLPQYKKKGVAARVIFFSLAIVLTHVVWRLSNRGRSEKSKYPYIVDVCISFVVTFDLFGNSLMLYDNVWWWDDAMHLLMSVPWSLAAAYFLRYKIHNKWALFTAVTTYGLTSAILWELWESPVFLAGHPVESKHAYSDTLGDLALGGIGTYFAAWLATRYLHDQKQKVR